MRVLQLNVWMGKIEGALKRFLEKEKFDVICMQEVMASDDREQHLSGLCFDRSQIIKSSGMPYAFYSPNWSSEIAGGSFMWGNLILSRIPFAETYSEFTSGKYQEHVLLGEGSANNLNIQKVKLENGLTVFNHHGYWQPQPLGNEGTVKAFQNVARIVQQSEGPVVLCGDFNIIHESPAMRALDFLRDLTDENQVKSTLSGIKVNFDVPCDHIMVNNKIEVQSFEVLDEVVSDHLGLVAEIDFKR